MRILRTWILMLAASSTFAIAPEVSAQPAGLNPGRDCQTIRTCNFARNGSYRGCLSSYSCRVCRFVRTACSVDGSRGVCQRMKCTWG
jgi:hypothetical protein